MSDGGAGGEGKRGWVGFELIAGILRDEDVNEKS